MKCDIRLQNGQVVTKNDLATIIQNSQSLKIDLDKAILLYALGENSDVSIDKQEAVISLIERERKSFSPGDDKANENDEMIIETKKLNDYRVSDRSVIVVQKGSTDAFNQKAWTEKIKQSLRDRIKNKQPQLQELDQAVESSFENVKAYNDSSSKIGHDIHRIAQIIFDHNLETLGSVKTKIAESNITFETDLINARDTIYEQAIEFILDFRKQIESTYPGCKFLSEVAFEQKGLRTDSTYASIKSKNLFGIIDLVVVDKQGKVHLYDFKTSAHQYNDWSSFKKDQTNVQIYTYKKMLGAMGLDVVTTQCVSVPLKIDNDQFDENTKAYSYKVVGIEKFQNNAHVIGSKPSYSHSRIVDNWFTQHFIAPKPEEWIETERNMNEIFITGVNDDSAVDAELDYYFTKDKDGKWVPDHVKLAEFGFYEYRRGHRLYKKDENSDGFLYSFKMPNGPVRRCTDIDDFRHKLRDALNLLSSSKLAEASRIAHAFAEEYNNANGQPDKINYSNILGPRTEQQIWLKREISHYLESGEFELNTDETYLKQGYLLWKHKTLGFVECVVVSSDYLMQTKRLAKGTTILGKIIDDGHVDKKEVMTASNGNVSLMRFMNFLSTSPGTKKWCSEMQTESGTVPCKIASIRVISPFTHTKEIRPNLQFIVNNYELLCDNSPNLLKDKRSLKRIDRNLFYNDAQGLALQAVAQCSDLRPIYSEFDTTKFSFDYGKVDDVLEFINKCINQLINTGNKVQYQDLENFDPSDPNWRAIFYLINIQNTLHGHTYIAEMGNGKWFNNGAPTGLMIAAPGMSTSTTLRTFDEINKAYVDSVIQSVNKHGAESKQAIDDMYRAHGMDSLLGGPNNAKHYYNMFETDEYGKLDHRFILKSPDNTDLSDSQQEVIRQFMILNYRLTTLAQGSKKALDPLTDEEKEEIWSNEDWLRVPLMDAAFSRQLFNHHKTSKSWFETVRYAVVNKWRELGNLYDDILIDDIKDFRKHMSKAYVIDRRSTWNSFNYTQNPDKRYNLLETYGPERFETNLEIVMNNMLVAYFKEFHSKRYAAQISALRLELAYAKKAGHDISDVIDVFDLAVRTKFYGESPIPPNLQDYFAPLARLKSVFSMLQIGGKAISMMKEMVYGTFIGFSNAIGKGLPGLNAETYWKAFAYVTSEIFKSSKGVGKLNHLQMKYHIANYGLSQVADQRKFNFLGMRNWGTDTLFLTATSPDFFHRSIVLVAKMMADGSWDAYDFDEKANNGSGELTYDVMKDERFAKFTGKYGKPDLNDPEYWQQKAMFEQYITEFNQSGVTDKNGEKLTVTPDADGNYYLPQPYLQREVDTFKNYADMLYGHYDEESKALVNDTFLGSFWLQYKTFVTAKIERYGMTPGVYNTHLLKQQYVTDENGNQEALYLKTVKEVTEDGREEFHRIVLRESELSDWDKELRRYGTAGKDGESVTAYIKWEGIPMEGIMQSMASLSRTIMRLIKGDKEAWGEFKLIWDDPTKRGNFIVALNDLIFMGLLGMTASALFGVHNDLDFTEAWGNEAAVRQLVRAGNWAENGLYDIFVGAMQDGPITNTISSMFQAPPIMTSIERAWNDSVKLLKGDSSAFEFLTNEVGALRIFDGMAKAANAD